MLTFCALTSLLYWSIGTLTKSPLTDFKDSSEWCLWSLLQLLCLILSVSPLNSDLSEPKYKTSINDWSVLSLNYISKKNVLRWDNLGGIELRPGRKIDWTECMSLTFGDTLHGGGPSSIFQPKLSKKNAFCFYCVLRKKQPYSFLLIHSSIASRMD